MNNMNLVVTSAVVTFWLKMARFCNVSQVAKKLFVLVAMLSCLPLGATDMEHKAKTVLTCPTARAGVAEITCDSPGGWKFSAEASIDADCDVVTVRIAAPKEMPPPQFGVYFRWRESVMGEEDHPAMLSWNGGKVVERLNRLTKG